MAVGSVTAQFRFVADVGQPQMISLLALTLGCYAQEISCRARTCLRSCWWVCEIKTALLTIAFDQAFTSQRFSRIFQSHFGRTVTKPMNVILTS